MTNTEILNTFSAIIDEWRTELREWAASNGFLTDQVTVSDHGPHDHQANTVRDG